MNQLSATVICFSPTGTTRQILEGVARGLDIPVSKTIDLTLPATGGEAGSVAPDSLTLIGAPVYSGRLPAEACRRLARLSGNGAPAVIVVVYGNREFEDALLELRDLAIDAGFVPVAAGAFLGEHSFSTEALPIAAGRPDEADMAVARAFGAQIRARMGSVSDPLSLPVLVVPGNSPYREPSLPGGPAPASLAEMCGLCLDCVDVCPTGAIGVEDGAIITDDALCIQCCACVRVCATGARVVRSPAVLGSAQWLSANCAVRREPQLFV